MPMPILAGHPAALSLRGGFSPPVAMALPGLDASVVALTRDSMAELLTSCALGYGATRVGLVNGPAIRALAAIVFNVFLPSMLVTSVAVTVASGASLQSLLVVPLAAWAQVLVGVVIGTLSSAFLRLPRQRAESAHAVDGRGAEPLPLLRHRTDMCKRPPASLVPHTPAPTYACLPKE